jgi:hypothetical protein
LTGVRGSGGSSRSLHFLNVNTKTLAKSVGTSLEFCDYTVGFENTGASKLLLLNQLNLKYLKVLFGMDMEA